MGKVFASLTKLLLFRTFFWNAQICFKKEITSHFVSFCVGTTALSHVVNKHKAYKYFGESQSETDKESSDQWESLLWKLVFFSTGAWASISAA